MTVRPLFERRDHVFGTASIGGEEGGGAVLGLFLVAAVAALVAAGVAAGQVVVAHQSLQGVADSAALAAADVASGRLPGVPCEAAASVTGELGAHLESCDIGTDTTAIVRVDAEVLGFTLTTAARAGPTPGAPGDGAGVS